MNADVWAESARRAPGGSSRAEPYASASHQGMSGHGPLTAERQEQSSHATGLGSCVRSDGRLLRPVRGARTRTHFPPAQNSTSGLLAENSVMMNTRRSARRSCRCDQHAVYEIAYNSCRNRHCPKCQGAAAQAWLAEREAELLPVPYFHVVFTLPSASRRHRLPEQGRRLRPAVPGRGRDPAHHRRRSQASGRPDRLHRRAAHLGPELTHHPHVH